MKDVTRMDRRDFVKVVGGGVVVFVSMGPTSLLSEAEAQRRGYPEDFNAYLHIGEDGKVTFFSGKIEMGQGTMTSQAQMAAEELCVSMDAVEIVVGDTARCPWDQGTWGSLTTRVFGPALRAACAKGREVLLDLAAERLGIPVSRLVAEDGVVYDRSDRDRKVGYAELTRGQRITRTLDRQAVLRSVRDFKVMGRSLKRLDGPEKATGEAKFAGDIRLEGMLYARILRPPAHGATLRSVDVSAARALPGVTVVEQDDLVAVLHADPEMAGRALQKVKADFQMPSGEPNDETIYDHLVANGGRANPGQQRGSLEAGRAAAAQTFEHEYRHSYGAHAPMEPHTAMADVRDGKATLWVSTQSPFGDQGNVARALGMPAEDVRVITPFVGGGFGGKSTNHQAPEAARLSQIVGRPVQVSFTRAEEFFYDTYRPAAVVKIHSGIGPDGKICLWDYGVYHAGTRGAEAFFDVPNCEVRSHGGGRGSGSPHPFATGAWRAPGANTNVFAIQSQLDIMAAAAGKDPLAFRLENTSDARMRRVLQAAADKFGYRPAAAPSGRGLGIACGLDAGSYVAHIAQVKVDASTGVVKVERVVVAQDMGIVVNPDGATMQVEGCVTMGLGYALSEDVRFRGGEILERNFDTYELPRFSNLPQIETVLVENNELEPQGGGEPAIICMGGVIANAIFDATGARLHRLPMTPERVLAALKKP